MIIVRNQEEVKKVTKPWGYEIWFAEPGNGDKFALKKIFIKAPHQSSFQFHEKKEETIFISEGTGVLHYSNKKIDIDAFKKNHYSDNDLLNIINNLDKKKLSAGDCITVKTGFVHSVEATTNLTIFEASTLELDDVYRLKDKHNRSHGHIENEHKS